MNIDNKRGGPITLAGGFILLAGVNSDVPMDVLKSNEEYLEALYKDGDITVLADQESPSLPFEKDQIFTEGDTVVDGNGDPVFDEHGNALVYDADGNHVPAE